MNTTILMHLMNDHPDRVDNARIVIPWVRRHLKARIILLQNTVGLLDYGWAYAQADQVLTVSDDVLCSPRYCNMMARAADTPIVAWWCHDVILERPKAFREAEHRIVTGECDVVYPYDSAYHVWREQHAELARVGSVPLTDRDGVPIDRAAQVKQNNGYIFLANRAAYLETGGGLNENFREYSPWDKEAYHRWNKIGLRIGRAQGAALHLFHWYAGKDGGDVNARIQFANQKEYERCLALSPAEMRAELLGKNQCHV